MFLKFNYIFYERFYYVYDTMLREGEVAGGDFMSIF